MNLSIQTLLCINFHPTLLSQCTKRLCRDGFAPNKHHRLCSKHFREQDLLRTSSDKIKWRKRSQSMLKHIQLKDGTIHLIFESTSSQKLPSYLTSSTLPEERLTSAQSEKMSLCSEQLVIAIIETNNGIPSHMYFLWL